VLEYLPTPELELFVVEFLIGIIYGGIFIDVRVGNIRDQIFIDARGRNIMIKPSLFFLNKKKIHMHGFKFIS
jgi:hypothetical protein